MPVITITGLNGSGALEIGADVAGRLGIDYVDRQILVEAARKTGTPVAVVADRTERVPTMGERISGFMRNVLERSAVAGPGGDPYFGGGVDALLVREYRDMPDVSTPGEEVQDKRLVEVLSGVMRELAQTQRVVVVGRGAHVILKDWPNALHVFLIASFEKRVQRIMERERMVRADAERYVLANDKGRIAYYHRYFKVNPHDPQQYHLTLNTDRVGDAPAADVIASAARHLSL